MRRLARQTLKNRPNERFCLTSALGFTSISRSANFNDSPTSERIPFLELTVLLAAFAFTTSFSHDCPPVCVSVVPGLAVPS